VSVSDTLIWLEARGVTLLIGISLLYQVGFLARRVLVTRVGPRNCTSGVSRAIG
jgi:hypothetical protein